MRVIVLIGKLMFQARPKIHGNGANLHFHLHFFPFIGKKYGDFHNQVQTAVAVGLGITDIIFLFDERNIVLHQKRIGNPIDIVYVRTYHADSRYVVQVFFYAFERYGKLIPYQFFYNALGAF